MGVMAICIMPEVAFHSSIWFGMPFGTVGHRLSEVMLLLYFRYTTRTPPVMGTSLGASGSVGSVEKFESGISMKNI